MENPLISVIIPVYKKESFISETLDSVVNQDFKNYEIIIINDGSPDKCPEICSKYAEKYSIIRIINQTNKGVIVARNNGISSANGLYIIPFDADDIMPKNFISNMANFASQHRDIDVIVPKVIYIGEKSGEMPNLSKNLPDILIRNSIPNTSMFKRSAIKEFGGYNENMSEGLEDWDFWLYFVERGKLIAENNDAFFYYRIESGSRNNMPKNKRELIKAQIYRNHKQLYDTWRPALILILLYPALRLLPLPRKIKAKLKMAKIFRSIKGGSKIGYLPKLK